MITALKKGADEDVPIMQIDILDLSPAAVTAVGGIVAYVVITAIVAYLDVGEDNVDNPA